MHVKSDKLGREGQATPEEIGNRNASVATYWPKSNQKTVERSNFLEFLWVTRHSVQRRDTF